MTLTRAVIPMLLIVSAPGCATVCRPIAFDVASKEERSRIVTEVRQVPAADGSGRIVEQSVPRRVQEYWVRDREGGWHLVSETEFRAAEPGTRAEICR